MIIKPVLSLSEAEEDVMTEKRRINVLIDGRSFTIVGAEDEKYIRELASYVDLNIKKLANKNEKLSPAMAVTLAAVNIADEYYRLQEKYKELDKRAKEPLEKYDILKEELFESNERVKEMENRSLSFQDEMIKTKLSKEDLFKEMNLLREQLEQQRNKETMLEKENKDCKDDYFKSQLEIVELKKQLSQALKLLDEK